MKSSNRFTPLFFLLMLLVNASCIEFSIGGGSGGGSGFIPPAGEREALVECEAGELHKAPYDVFNILEFNEHLVFFGEKFFVQKKENQEIVFESSMKYNDVVKYQGQIVICTEVGLYTLDTEMNLDKRNSVSCRKAKLGPAGQLLFTPFSGHTYARNVVYEMDASFSNVTPYTQYSEDIPGGPLLNFTVSPNGTVWGWTSKQTIVKYENRKYKEEFSSENAPLYPEDETKQIFLMPYQNEGLIVAAHQNSGGTRLMKYADGNWITLKDFSFPNPQNATESGIGRLDVYDAMLIDQQLYLLFSYNLFLRADISVDREFLPGEFVLIDDPAFDEMGNVGRFSPTENGDIYFHNSSGQYMVFDCN